MKTKQIPFSLEMVKKIQAGEVKGIIKTRDGRKARYLGKVLNNRYPLVFAHALDESGEEVASCIAMNGLIYYGGGHSDDDIIIEIEEQKQEHQFKVGDKVRVKPNDTHSYFVKQYNNCIGKIIEIFHETFVIVVEGAFQDLFSADELELVEKTENHEFKPFDKVLVRDEESGYRIWQAAFYSHFYIGKDNGYHVTTAGDLYLDGEIIPYEGNEHLLGTTDKPKEE